MAKKETKKPPIGFGRKPDPDPNGTDDGYRWHSGDAEEEKPGVRELLVDEKLLAMLEQLSKPKREPVGTPAFVGELEALEMLEAYGIINLTPLNKLDFQLLGIIKGLEEEVQGLRRAEPDETE